MIHEILQTSYRVYACWRDGHFYRYCQHLALAKGFEVRELYANDLMLNYFQDMWLAYIEKPFLRDNEPYLHLGEPDCLWSVLETYISTIYDENGVKMYPSALLNEIKKERKLCKHH